MARDVRWMTLACAKKFAKSANAEAAFGGGQQGLYDSLYKQLFSQKPATWFVEGGPEASVRSRTAGLKASDPRPGTRVIGQLKISSPAQRGWVWRDDWSVIGEDLGKPYFWLIAVGKRSKDSPQHDLQEKAKSLLHDPNDRWRPTLNDYRDLAAFRNEKIRVANIEAIHQARSEAHENKNTVVTVDLADHAAEIAEAYVEDSHQGVVIEYFTVRYFIVSLHYANGDFVPNAELEDLASFAFDDLDDGEWGTDLSPGTYIEDLKVDPEKVMCFVADLPTDD